VTTIPLIDLARWFDGGPSERAQLAREVDEHLCRLGFLLVVNHGIPDEVIARCREASLDFFHLPTEVKAKGAIDGPIYRGWVDNGLESNAATYGVDTPPDLKETFAAGPPEVDEELRLLAPRSYPPNVWPEEPPEFAAALEGWWVAGRGLADELLALFEQALRVDAGTLTGACARTTSLAVLNWYLPGGGVAAARDQFRVGPHTDFGTLTLVDRQRGKGGLQVCDEDGEWIDAPWVEGGLIVNTGDLLRRWTNDRWCSNRHRVLPPPVDEPDEELLSLVFFHEPSYDAMIEALPSCVPEGALPRHPPVRSDEYLAAKMDALVVD
jgi:isopenicillin N synthase-like dioxygenase